MAVHRPPGPPDTLETSLDLGPGVLLAGPRGAPPLVLIHGTRMSRTMWRPVMEHLAATHRCASLDLPGHGELAGEPFTMAGAAERVATVARALAAEADDGMGTARATLVGLSLGGYVAIETAARHPDAVGGLVLAGCSREPVRALAAAMRLLAWSLELTGGRASRFASRLYFRVRYGSATSRAILEGGLWEAGGAQALRALTGRRFRPLLAAAPHPALVVNGAWDPVFRPAGASFARATGRPHLVLARAAHLTNLDRPKAFASAVSSFVAGSVVQPGPAVTSSVAGPSDRAERGPMLS